MGRYVKEMNAAIGAHKRVRKGSDAGCDLVIMIQLCRAGVFDVCRRSIGI